MLEKMPILSSLSQRDWEKVKHLFVVKRFGKDDYIFFEGDPASWLGVVLEGRVNVKPLKCYSCAWTRSP
jgi:CRP-like cAMP-binding protein